jgi:hypothetical protein
MTMKIIVQLEPDAAELALNELENSDFILDQETYCYFRDEIFIKEMEEFIKKIAPGKWQDTANLEGAEKVESWYVNQDLVNKYYPKYNRRRQRFYLHNGEIYFYKFLGFMNVDNEIQLMQLDMRDIVGLLNRYAESSLNKFLRKLNIV